MIKIPVHIAQKLLLLSQGETIPSSSAKHAFIEELITERIIERRGRIQKTLILVDSKSLFQYLQNKHGINNLEKYITVQQKENVQRNELVEISSNSKLKQVRTFKGFLINTYEPIRARLNDKPMALNCLVGSFQFIYDFANFIPDVNVTIIGIENPENFRYIEKQKHLFKNIQPLFVSRYPQHQSKDLIKWLQSIPNNYLHFGDFDFAGIAIYLHEFKKHLDDKASFFVPDNIEVLIRTNGNRKLYNNQKINFRLKEIQEAKLIQLIEIIHRNKKGLEQEILIG